MFRRLLLVFVLLVVGSTSLSAETATVTCVAPNGGFYTDGTNFQVLNQGETAQIAVRPEGSLVTLWSCGWPDPVCQFLPYTVLPNSTWQIINIGGAKIVFDPIDFDGDGMQPPVDCNDADISVYPGAAELCDEKDNDCDGFVPVDEQDIDGDGFIGCTECNDLEPDVNPDALELPGNFVDENCDGNLGNCDPCFPWRNHGEYVRCVAHKADELVVAGVLTEEEGDALVSGAAQSEIGKKNHVPEECMNCDYGLGMNCPPSGDSQSFIDGFDVQINGGFVNLPSPCAPVTRASWDWGDGTIDEFLAVGDPPYVYPFANAYTYGQTGTYAATLRLFDAEGTELDVASCSLSID